MTISGDGGMRVDGPACRPARYGLRSVADVEEQAGDEWSRGLEWDELPCGYDPGSVSGQCPPLPEQLKVAARGFDTLYADAFTVYAGWECSTGGLELAKAWDNADQLLERNWWRALERIFWTGLDQDGNPVRSTLGTSAPVDLTPPAGALEISSGVAVLESFAADCFDCEPIVHANRGLATYVQERGLLETDGASKRLAATGTLFAPGGGYLDDIAMPEESGAESPGALPAGEAWMAVTGGVSLVHGRRFFTPERGDLAGAVDRSVNDITVFAERNAAFELGCCVAAVRVTLTSCCCG